MGALAHDATASVTRGLALTGRVITAAAAIMVTVFASFMIGEDRIIKLFGLGLASAVFIDAVIIRSVPRAGGDAALRQTCLVATRPGSTASSQGSTWSLRRATPPQRGSTR